MTNPDGRVYKFYPSREDFFPKWCREIRPITVHIDGESVDFYADQQRSDYVYFRHADNVYFIHARDQREFDVLRENSLHITHFGRRGRRAVYGREAVGDRDSRTDPEAANLTRADIEAVIAYLPELRRASADRDSLPATVSDEFPVEFSGTVRKIVDELQKRRFMYPFDYMSWMSEAERLIENPDALLETDLETIRKLLVVHWRKDYRDHDNSHWEQIAASGHLVSLLERLEKLAEDMEPPQQEYEFVWMPEINTGAQQSAFKTNGDLYAEWTFSQTDRSADEETETEPRTEHLERGERESDGYYYTRQLTYRVTRKLMGKGQEFRTPQLNMEMLRQALNLILPVERKITRVSYVAPAFHLRFYPANLRENDFIFADVSDVVNVDSFLEQFGIVRTQPHNEQESSSFAADEDDPSIEELSAAFLAIRDRITEQQLIMLKAHYHSGGRAITMRELATASGYGDYKIANLQYGSLAKKLLNALGREAPRYEGKTPIAILVLGEIVNRDEFDLEMHLVMHDSVAFTLEGARYFETGRIEAISDSGSNEDAHQITNDFIVYNNTDTVGELFKKAPLSVFTNKRVSENVLGGRVWLIAGSGQPRKFFLRSWFIIENVGSGAEHGFSTCLRGTEGQVFDPMIEIDPSEWFTQLKKDQGNFAFGFNPIKDAGAIAGFEGLIKEK